MDTSFATLEPPQLNPQMPSLDLDVLDTICAFLTEYPDFLSLSLTCSILRPIAVRNMLRNRPVVLKNVDTICKFHDFVFFDPARLHHVTSLRIDVAHNATHPEGSERAIDCLLAMLRRAPSLTSLELHSSANGRPLGYLDDPRLATAIGEVCMLRELTICGRTEAADLISVVRSPLKKLAIRFMDPTSSTEWSPASLSAALSHLAHCIESISILHSPVRLIPAGTPPDRVLTCTQFHALRSLTLNSPTGILHLPVLLELFPNLNGTLYLFGYPDPGGDPEDGPDSFRATRERNGAAQEQRSWKRLERLICAVETLFILNLRSQIGVTIVQPYMAVPDGESSRYLVESLRAHPPTRLNVRIPLPLVGQHEAPLSGMVPPEAAGVLTHLTLCVSCGYQNSEYWPVVRWDDLWRKILRPVLPDLRALTHLRFIFHCDAWINGGPISVSNDAFLRDLRPASFDFTTIAHSIADAIPSLRYCFLTTSAYVAEMLRIPMFSVAERWRESRAWRVATCGDSAKAGTTCARNWELVELHDDAAETLIIKEDLDLSVEEEEAMHWR